MSEDLGKSVLVLEANLTPFRKNMKAGKGDADAMQHALDAVAAVANIAESALNDVRMKPSQGAETKATAESIISGVRGIGEEARRAARDLDDVKLDSANAAETTASGDIIDRKLKDIVGNANEARRSLESVRLAGAAAAGSGGSNGGRNGVGVGPFGSGFGRMGVLGAAVAGGTLLGPAAGPGALGLLAAIPTLATTGAGAIGTLALAFAGVGKAIGGDKKAFDALLPVQQAFVQQVRSLTGWLDKLKQTAASNMFPGLTEALHSALSPGTLSAVTTAVAEFGRAIGNAGAAWGRYFGSAEFQSIFGPLMATGARNLSLMSDAALHLFDAMGVLARAAIPLTSWMTEGIAAGSRWADAFLHAKDATGALGRSMDEAKTSLQLVGNLFGALLRAVGDLGSALYPVSKIAVKDLTDGLNALADIIKRNKDGIREIVSGALDALVSTVKIAAPIVAKLAHALGDVVHAVGGWKTAFEIVLTGVLAAKLAGVASSLGDIRLGMLDIAKLGPIAVVIALSMVRKNNVGQAELDKMGLGFLGNIPIIGNAGTQITAAAANATQSAILGAGHALGIGTQNGMTPAQITAAAARSGKIDMTTGLPLPGKGPGPIPISGSTSGVKSSLLANISAAAASVGAESIVITSGARSKGHNAAVGGVGNSNHLTGDAVDGYAIIGGQKVPLGTALKSVAAKYGIRSGDVAGFFNGRPDPVHVDDAANQGYSPFGSDPAFTKNLGPKAPKPTMPTGANLLPEALRNALQRAKDKATTTQGATAAMWLNTELDDLDKARANLSAQLKGSSGKKKAAIEAELRSIDGQIASVTRQITTNLHSQASAIKTAFASKITEAKSGITSAVGLLKQTLDAQFEKATQAYIDTVLGPKFFQGSDAHGVGLQTPLEKQLAGMQAADTLKGLTDAVAAATDPATLTAAQRQLDEYQLGIKATAERSQADFDYAQAVKQYQADRSELERQLNQQLDQFGKGLLTGATQLSDLGTLVGGFGLSLVGDGGIVDDFGTLSSAVQDLSNVLIAEMQALSALGDSKDAAAAAARAAALVIPQGSPTLIPGTKINFADFYIASQMRNLELPKLDTGGTVLETGLAVVHRGETYSGIGANRMDGGATLQVGPVYGTIDQSVARQWAATLKAELDRLIQL